MQNTVEGTLAENADMQESGSLGRFYAWKKDLTSRYGLNVGIDINTHYLTSTSDSSPSDAASNVFRCYGTWALINRDTPNNGAIVFKVENRSAITDHIPTQSLGPSIGYAGLLASTYSDAGWVVTNLFWRQSFADGKASMVIGQVDVYDYTNVNSLANPWTSFTNLEFQQQGTFAGPDQGLGAAMMVRLGEDWAVLGGIANANGNPHRPIDSAETLFETGETFKHVGLGWTSAWSDRIDRLLQITLWQVDERKKKGVPEGHGLSLAVSGQWGDWRPFFRAGWADDGGTSLEYSVSGGLGYDLPDRNDQLGVGLNWGQAHDSSRNQWTMEAFYRWDITSFLQLSPQAQYIINPSYNQDEDSVLVAGARMRIFF